MKIEIIPVGYLEANCYLITKNQATIIIDPGSEFEKIKKNCNSKNIVGVLVTHHHFDHVEALEEVEKEYKLKHNPKVINGFHYQIIQNPGHSKDSISFFFPEENILFSGDFIFYGNIGRCDLEGGNFSEMQESIKNILSYKDSIVIYPGHGPKTTLGEEKLNLKKYI